MAPQSSSLAWKIPRMEELGRLPSMGSLRVGHYWATSLSLFTFMHWRRKWQSTSVFLPGESQGWGAWWAAVYGVAQSQKWLKWLNSSSTAFTESHRCFVVLFSFLFVSRHILISLLISSLICLFTQKCVVQPPYVCIFNSFFFPYSWKIILLCCDQKRCLKWFQFFLNLSRLDLWLRTWSILENVPCALEKKVNSVFQWNALQISIR